MWFVSTTETLVENIPVLDIYTIDFATLYFLPHICYYYSKNLVRLFRIISKF